MASYLFLWIYSEGRVSGGWVCLRGRLCIRGRENRFVCVYVCMQGVRDMDGSPRYEGSHRSACQRWGKRLRPVAWPRSAHRQSCSYQDVKEQQRAGHSQDSRWPSLITHLTLFLAIINTQPEQMALYSNKERANVWGDKNQGETLLAEKGLKSQLTDTNIRLQKDAESKFPQCWCYEAWAKYKVLNIKLYSGICTTFNL